MSHLCTRMCMYDHTMYVYVYEYMYVRMDVFRSIYWCIWKYGCVNMHVHECTYTILPNFLKLYKYYLFNFLHPLFCKLRTLCDTTKTAWPISAYVLFNNVISRVKVTDHFRVKSIKGLHYSDGNRIKSVCTYARMNVCRYIKGTSILL